MFYFYVLQRSHKEITKHRPEVILNNFSTHLGNTVSRMLAALFHYEPEFKGRRAVTFHNQRDYIFFRHHRFGSYVKGCFFRKAMFILYISISGLWRKAKYSISHYQQQFSSLQTVLRCLILLLRKQSKLPLCLN